MLTRIRSAITGRFTGRAGADPATTVEERVSTIPNELADALWDNSELVAGLLGAAGTMSRVADRVRRLKATLPERLDTHQELDGLASLLEARALDARRIARDHAQAK
jgi:hypothetical protein